MNSTFTIEMPDGAAEILGSTEKDLGREVIVAAVLRWFERADFRRDKPR
jgi:hypothetical protein